MAIEENLLGKATAAGRKRAYRYLRELYVLDPTELLFRCLRDLWDEDPADRPLIAGLVAYARDSVFRASANAIFSAERGATVTSGDLAQAVTTFYPGVYSPATANKIGRNTGSSWTQTGHLAGRARKTRTQAMAGPASLALALFLGHLQGSRGQALLSTPWIAFLDVSKNEIDELVDKASVRGYIETRSAGNVLEFGFSHLQRPMKGA
ncbi:MULTISPECIES: hypothetical protein [unclassified Rhodococcus (in: high G+C Gram-positive bacteria)]|uniref:hypothetical protein n=1 Tax=unclassified Rhodococcus (in: high G+C Gram-positive bacteria) TaxID=192944 RepID=UPI0012E388A0|nr:MULTISPECIES: hypothetical protein [unclassified Rhodococcus (in: high G+C Gram-positive bacteria)]